MHVKVRKTMASLSWSVHSGGHLWPCEEKARTVGVASLTAPKLSVAIKSR